MQIPKELLTENSPLLRSELSPLPIYHTQLKGDITPKEIELLISSLTKEGFWLTPLKNTSNPYLPNPNKEKSTNIRYHDTMVGDKYDTSCYPCITGELCISVGYYIDSMRKLIEAIK